MTPILLEFFADPANHEFLIEREPVLCYTILTIASQNFHLPQSNAAFREAHIHAKAWNVTKQLINRVVWAQERGPKSKLRTLGTVLALLLLTEWPPRAIDLPPDDMDEFIPMYDDVETADTDLRRFPTLEDEERRIKIAYGTVLSRRLLRKLLD